MPPNDAFAHDPGQILDDPDEMFDLVDLDDHVIGQVRRGEAHRNPALIHRSVQVLVFTHAGQMLLQRRSASKDLFPGYYCASASGHVASGEHYATTAERELIEELGISTRALDSLKKAGIENFGQFLEKLNGGNDAVLAISGFGQASLTAAKKKLRSLGYEIPAAAAA